MRECDLCGYENESKSAVQDFPDGVKRCRVCISKLAHGRYIGVREAMHASDEQLAEWNREYDEWYKTLEVTDVGNRHEGEVDEYVDGGDG